MTPAAALWTAGKGNHWLHISGRRSVSEGGSRRISGYSIVSADSLDAAVELAKGCPVLEIGGAVDVYEAIKM